MKGTMVSEECNIKQKKDIMGRITTKAESKRIRHGLLHILQSNSGFLPNAVSGKVLLMRIPGLIHYIFKCLFIKLEF